MAPARRSRIRSGRAFIERIDRDNFFEVAYKHFAEPGVWELYPEVPQLRSQQHHREIELGPDLRSELLVEAVHDERARAPGPRQLDKGDVVRHGEYLAPTEAFDEVAARIEVLDAQNEESANGDSASSSLLVHLGMTGHIASTAAAQPLEKHTHAIFALDDGRELRYTDARRFGRLAYFSAEMLPAELEGFGAEPLLVTAEEFATRIGSRQSRIKALLLDQSVLRGVGNIYADESLWRAKIHPAKLGANLE